MKSLLNLIFISVIPFILSCSDNPEIDQEKPVIDNSMPGAFPINCDTIYFGETFHLNMLFTDNVELGTYSVNIHDNFNHHSHSTDVAECNSHPDKLPVNPYSLIIDFTIPAGQTSFETNEVISIPTGNSNGQFDEGDYHFFISLTDKEGWSTQKGISVKMLHLK